MATPAPAPRWMLPAVAAALVVAAVVFAVAPFLPILKLYPTGPDVVLWISDPDPHKPTGWEAVFLRPHFIGYRPVTALTFAFDNLIPNGMPYWFRATDILCHVLAGLGLASVWAVFTEGRTRAWAIAAAVAFWTSPLNELVVPFVTRRSYSVAALFSFLAVTAAWHGLQKRSHAWVGLAAFSLFLSELSNETGFVVAPVLVMLGAMAEAPDLRARAWRALEVAAPTVLVTGMAALLRAWVLRDLGGIGGYQGVSQMVAVVDAGERRMQLHASLLDIFTWAWRGSTLADDLSGTPNLLLGHGLAIPVGLAFAAWAAAWTVHRAVKHQDPLPALLAVWAGGYTVLSVAAGVWFPRMSYTMGGPVAIWLVYLGLQSVRGRARWNLVPLALVLASRLWSAPPITGIERRDLKEQGVANRSIRQAIDAVRTVKGPALVWVETHVDPRSVLSEVLPIRAAAPKGVEVRALTQLWDDDEPSFVATARVEDGVLQLDPHAEWTPDVRRSWPTHPRAPIAASVLKAADGRPTYLVLHEGLVPVESP